MSSKGGETTQAAGLDPDGTESPRDRSPGGGESVETEANEGSNGAGGGDHADGLSKDEAFDVLRNGRRRAAVSVLREHGGTMEVSDLATKVAADEYDVDEEEVTSTQFKRVYTGLYQCHLERMDDIDVVEFETETNTVTLREPASDLAPYLDGATDRSAARRQLLAALAVAGGVTVGLVAPGPLAPASPILLAAVTVVALFGFALVQLVGDR